VAQAMGPRQSRRSGDALQRDDRSTIPWHQETVENLVVLTPHFETDDVRNAPRQRDLC
jgi:hypothetical protein